MKATIADIVRSFSKPAVAMRPVNAAPTVTPSHGIISPSVEAAEHAFSIAQQRQREMYELSLAKQFFSGNNFSGNNISNAPRPKQVISGNNISNAPPPSIREFSRAEYMRILEAAMTSCLSKVDSIILNEDEIAEHAFAIANALEKQMEKQRK